MTFYFSGNVVDQNDVPVIGAEVYVFAGGFLADLVDEEGDAVANPVRSTADGFYEARTNNDGEIKAEFYWAGRKRYVREVSRSAEVVAAAATALAAAATALAASGPFYTTTAEGIAATTDGQEFNVRANLTDPTADVYLNSEGTALYSRTFIIAPDAPGTAALIGTTAGDLQAVLDDFEARITALEP